MTFMDTRVIATGLQFPEGPVAMPDGSVIVVEIARGTLSRVDVASGAVHVVGDCGGGPNGAALGPDGRMYVCNNGGYFSWIVSDGSTFPGPTPDTYAGGSIQRVNIETGEVETLYDSCDGRPLVAPNDLVFDDHGGFWFTDHGVQHGAHPENPGLLYAKADGSSITAAAFGTDATNGVGLSPAGDRVYAAETSSGTVWEWAVVEPGVIGPVDPDLDPTEHSGGRLLYDAPQGHLYDSLAVDGDGWVCVATIGPGGVTAISPDGTSTELHEVADEWLVTNICFAARTVDGDDDPDLRTAYVTSSSTGLLVAARWPRAGLRLPFQQ